MSQAVLARKIYFSCAHRYFSPQLSEEENQRIFGSCYTHYGHGHNYALEAYFAGPIDPITGMIINLMTIDEILKQVVQPLDHHHLNFDVAHFKDLVPTTENIARYCFDQIQSRLKQQSVRLLRVRLHETDDIWVDYGEELAIL